MATLSEISDSFIDTAKRLGFDIKPQEGLISSFFEGDFNQSAATQYIIPALASDKDERIQRIGVTARCFRRADLGKIGYSNFHLLFFEMGMVGILGYMEDSDLRGAFSQILKFSFEWFHKVLGLDKSRFLYTVCREAEVLGEYFPEDRDSIESLKKLGVQEDQILPISGRANFMYSKGMNRPAGYSIELLYQINKSFVEIASANICRHISQENRLVPAKNVACGNAFGFERIQCVVNSNDSIFEAEFLAPLTNFFRSLFPSGTEFLLCKEKVRLVIELIRSVIFIIAEGQPIDKSGRGQILKNLLKQLYSELDFLYLAHRYEHIVDQAVSVVCKSYENRHPFLKQKEKQIKESLQAWNRV